MHSVAKGDITVAILTARFLQLGWVVLKPVTELSRYDLVIDRGNGFERVQCKTGRTKAGTIRFNTCSSVAHHRKDNARRPYIGQVDLFGVYHPESDECFLMPVSDLGSVEGSLRIERTKNGQSLGVRFAKDYRLVA